MKHVKEFIYNNLMYAVLAKHESGGMPYLAILAQAALESGWGKHAIGNNFFGIKAGSSWDGEIMLKETTEYKNGEKLKEVAAFRKYFNAKECFIDHAKLMKNRFPKAFEYSDPVKFIKSVQEDHDYKYATDPQYVDKIESIIEMIRKHLKLKDVEKFNDGLE